MEQQHTAHPDPQDSISVFAATGSRLQDVPCTLLPAKKN